MAKNIIRNPINSNNTSPKYAFFNKFSSVRKSNKPKPLTPDAKTKTNNPMMHKTEL